MKSFTQPHLEQRFTSASEALEALQSKHYLKTSLTTFPQPKGSRVKLKKSPKQLSIQIPKKKRSVFQIFQLCCNLILTVGSLPFLLLSAIITLGLAIGSLTALFWNPFLLIFLLPLLFFLGRLWLDTSQEFDKVQNAVSQALQNVFGCHCLYFDRERFIVERQFLGLHYRSHHLLISDIKNLQQIPFQELIIQTRMLNYSFAEQLTESERDWLFNEIQNWLNYQESSNG